VDTPMFLHILCADICALCAMFHVRRRRLKMVKMVPKLKIQRKAEG
jgi:hypothetical protein